MILKTTYKRRPIDYGSATAYNWVNDPFSDPLERIRGRDKRKEDNRNKHRK